MTGIEYMSNVCPTTSNGRDPNREDVADAFEDGIAEGVKRHWKPSEAQMSMLLAVINEPRNAGAESCQLALGDLYQDLKKLM